MPAVDLTEMSERLKKDWFYQYMLAPQKFQSQHCDAFISGPKAKRFVPIFLERPNIKSKHCGNTCLMVVKRAHRVESSESHSKLS